MGNGPTGIGNRAIVSWAIQNAFTVHVLIVCQMITRAYLTITQT